MGVGESTAGGTVLTMWTVFSQTPRVHVLGFWNLSSLSSLSSKGLRRLEPTAVLSECRRWRSLERVSGLERVVVFRMCWAAQGNFHDAVAQNMHHAALPTALLGLRFGTERALPRRRPLGSTTSYLSSIGRPT